MPTEAAPRGGRRLHAPFAEWMMGLVPGHVTAVEGLTRTQQLKAIGNGVVPLQAFVAYAFLMSDEPATQNVSESEQMTAF
ncbi:hypothetical protein [Streptomyces sp. NPDC050507]|uniref:hypothetical protein n=1 Tax=Streptomyces sp. NPDC050507 TaxID=3365619 RepID=UPI00379889C7